MRWGEQIRVGPDNSISIGMVFAGLTRQEAENVWQPIRDWVSRPANHVAWESPLAAVDLPPRHFWDPAFLTRHAPGSVVLDDRPTGHEGSFFWTGNRGEAGQFMHGYRSAWLAATLLDEQRQDALAEAIFAASRHWSIQLHFNKGLAGAPEAERAAARETAMNPMVVDAFALAVIAASGPPAFPDMPGAGPDRVAARRNAVAVGKAMDELLRVVPTVGSYVSESDFFERDWRDAYWGSNYSRLAEVKRRYDPDGLFSVHHGVGSE
jgi:FAD/FMN-containing dehydrogenase